MIKIKTYPKRDIEKGDTGSKDKILISIVSTVETHLEQSIKDKYREALELRFDDLWLDPNGDNIESRTDLYRQINGLRICDWTDIGMIKNFVERNDGIDIDIHCAAGVSRSGAVAVGIAIMKNDKKLWRWVLDNNLIHPNERIVMRFIEEFNPHYQCMSIGNMNHIISNKSSTLEVEEKVFCGIDYGTNDSSSVALIENGKVIKVLEGKELEEFLSKNKGELNENMG